MKELQLRQCEANLQVLQQDLCDLNNDIMETEDSIGQLQLLAQCQVPACVGSIGSLSEHTEMFYDSAESSCSSSQSISEDHTHWKWSVESSTIVYFRLGDWHRCMLFKVWCTFCDQNTLPLLQPIKPFVYRFIHHTLYCTVLYCMLTWRTLIRLEFWSPHAIFSHVTCILV